MVTKSGTICGKNEPKTGDFKLVIKGENQIRLQKEIERNLKSRKEELEFKLKNDAFRAYKEIIRISKELQSVNKTIKILEKD
jgi:hypothetical protein